LFINKIEKKRREEAFIMRRILAFALLLRHTLHLPSVVGYLVGKIYLLRRSAPSLFLRGHGLVSKQGQTNFSYFITKVEVNL
jgi:hypothetical protein